MCNNIDFLSAFLPCDTNKGQPDHISTNLEARLKWPYLSRMDHNYSVRRKVDTFCCMGFSMKFPENDYANQD